MAEIPKGTLVRLQTTNGGDTIVTVVNTYRPSYGGWFSLYGLDTFYVEPTRIKSVEISQ